MIAHPFELKPSAQAQLTIDLMELIGGIYPGSAFACMTKCGAYHFKAQDILGYPLVEAKTRDEGELLRFLLESLRGDDPAGRRAIARFGVLAEEYARLCEGGEAMSEVFSQLGKSFKAIV